MLLSPPLDVPADQVFAQAFFIFETELKDKDTRPRLFDRFIFIDVATEIFGKPKSFWHIASIGEDDEKYSELPCAGDSAEAKCLYKCDPMHEGNFLNEENSIPCIFRACRIRWIKESIELANKKLPAPLLRVWQQGDQKSRDKKILIRFTDDEVDYVVVFRIAYKNSDIYMYYLMTAYPVVLPGYKRRFDKEYENFIRKK